MREEGQGDRSRANYQIRSDLNVEFSDVRIVAEAAECAITLFAHAVNGEKLEHNKAKTMFDKIAHVLAWCYVCSVEASVKKENESEVQ